MASKRKAIFIIQNGRHLWINLDYVKSIEIQNDEIVIIYDNNDTQVIEIKNVAPLESFLSAISFNVFAKTEKEGGDVGGAENL